MVTPERKRTLLEWAQTVASYDSLKITDFSTSWQNGMAFCSIVHYYQPDLIDWDKLNPEDKLGNLDIAFQALKTIGIASLLDPASIATKPDENAILSYLSAVHSHLSRLPRQPNSIRTRRKSTNQYNDDSPLNGLFSPDTEVQNKKANVTYKVIMLGDASVGKSALFERWRSDSFKQTSTTVGMELWTKTYYVEGKYIQIQLWDTAGQEIYRAVTKSYYRESMGVLLVYDITKLDTLHHLSSWIKEFKSTNGTVNIPVIMIGNKSDMEPRMVQINDAEQFAQNNGFLYIETSARNGNSCLGAFQLLFQEIYKVQIQKPITERDENNVGRTIDPADPISSDCPC